MSATYTEAKRKYYRVHKDTIYRRVKKYKAEYNKEYYKKNREVCLMRTRLYRLKKKAEADAQEVANALSREKSVASDISRS